MTKVEQRKLFMKLRDACKTPKFEVVGGHLYSKGSQYKDIAQALLDTKLLDVDYARHIKGDSGNEMAMHPEDLTFKECCTALTYVIRSEHWSEGSFAEYLKAGAVYKLLSRLVETLP